MNYLVDKYIKKPEYVKELLAKPVIVSLKIDGSAFQISCENDNVTYHKRGGSSSKLGPIIDDYTQMFTKHLNDAIDYFKAKEDILKKYKFYAIEIFNDSYILLNVIDSNDALVDDVSKIAKSLDIESLPILLNGKPNDEQRQSLIDMLAMKEDTPNEDFVSCLTGIFGNGSYTKFLKGDEVEGIVLTWEIDNNIEQYKIINPAFKTNHQASQQRAKEEAEKESAALGDLIKCLYDSACNFRKHTSEKWLDILNEVFLKMTGDENVKHEILKYASKLTPNTNKFYQLQLNKVDNAVKDTIEKYGEAMKIAYEKYMMNFYKPKKRGFVISKEFQAKLNNLIEILQSKKESLSLRDYILIKS